MKKILFTAVFIISLCAAPSIFARHEVNLPKAGITPATPFYFIDQLGEKLKLIFTFNPEAKVELLHKQALERISEVKEMLDKKGINAPGIQIALSNLNKNLIQSRGIVGKLKEKGENPSNLAKKINASFHENRKAAKAAFENAKEDFLLQKDELIEKFKEAVSVGDFELANSIKEQLEKIESEKNASELIKDSAILKLEAEKNLVAADLETEERMKDETEMKFEKLEEEAEKLRETEKEKEREQKIDDIEKELNSKIDIETLKRGGEFLENLEKTVNQEELNMERMEKEQGEADKNIETEEERLDSLNQ